MFLSRHQRGKLCIAAICSLAVQSAEAEQPDLTEFSPEQLLDVWVTSASKYEQHSSDAPPAVQIISRKEINRPGWRMINAAGNCTAERAQSVCSDEL